MNIEQAIRQRRTIRRFQNKPVDRQQMLQLADLSRLYASGANLQPIRYVGVTDSALLDEIFVTLRWAAYLPEFTIRENQRPMAYMVLTCEEGKKKSCQFDLGAAATTLMLAAEGMGLATCCLASFNGPAITKLLSLPENVVPLLVIALGYPDQKSQSVPLKDDVKYYENEEGVLCVPKRNLEDILTLL